MNKLEQSLLEANERRYQAAESPLKSHGPDHHLRVFGPVGCARIIMVRTLKGDTMEEIVADFYTGGHLKRKWDSITTKEAREMAR